MRSALHDAAGSCKSFRQPDGTSGETGPRRSMQGTCYCGSRITPGFSRQAHSIKKEWPRSGTGPGAAASCGRCAMQEELDGPNEDEPEYAESPRQDNGVRAAIGLERDARDVEPESSHSQARDDVDDDDPRRKLALDRTAAAELDHENEGEDRSG